VSARLSTGALVWAGFDGPAVPGPLLDAIERGRIGGLLLFAYRGNIRSRDQVRGMLREATTAAHRGGPQLPQGLMQLLALAQRERPVRGGLAHAGQYTPLLTLSPVRYSVFLSP